ncbi:MAG: hypothetical protein IT371_31470 [Deltaproteobacteria bacterium]|nr:hypothetical protein [Deltaproteobacteria bacterium]
MRRHHRWILLPMLALAWPAAAKEQKPAPVTDAAGSARTAYRQTMRERGYSGAAIRLGVRLLPTTGEGAKVRDIGDLPVSEYALAGARGEQASWYRYEWKPGEVTRGAWRASVPGTGKGWQRSLTTGVHAGPLSMALSKHGVAELRNEQTSTSLWWAGDYLGAPVRFTESARVVQVKPGFFVVNYSVKATHQANGTPLERPIDAKRTVVVKISGDSKVWPLTLEQLWNSSDGNPHHPEGATGQWLHQVFFEGIRPHVVKEGLHLSSGHDMRRFPFSVGVYSYRQNEGPTWIAAGKLGAFGRALLAVENHELARSWGVGGMLKLAAASFGK